MQYTIYRVTNKINGKVYIGSHKTKNLNDDYMGSGKYLRYSINKHGIEHFEKEILHVFDSSEEMYAKEAELVDKEFIAESNTYNLKVGGHGGWDHINDGSAAHRERCTTAGRKGGATRHISKKELKSRLSTGITNSEHRHKMIVALTESRKQYPKSAFYGKKHTKETKAVMSSKAKERLKDPTQNSQYGTCWIYNDKESKKIKKSDLQEYIALGWRKGRKMKFT